jgi:hypothetical protein
MNAVVDVVKGVNARWERFWFEPQSPLPLCIFRVIFGAVMMISFLVQFRQDFLLFFGTNAVIPTSSIDVFQWLCLPVFDLFLVLPANDGVRLAFLYFSAFIAFLVMIGFATRFTTVILFLCYLSICNHFPVILMAGDNYARLISLFLCFSPCGERVSLDALRRKTSVNAKFSPCAQRLIQVQLCVIYFVNVTWKLAGAQWRDGSAVYHATRLLDYTKVSIPAALDVPIASIFFTWSTLILEFAIVFLLWSSNKKLRYSTITLTCIFHLGLDYCFSLGVFEWYFIASLILFIDPQDLERFWSRFVAKLSAATVAKPLPTPLEIERTNGKLSAQNADRYASVKKRFSKTEQFGFSLLIVAFFIVANAIALSHLPENENWLIPIVRRYAGFFGLEQNWTMFSGLRKANFHMLAVISFRDGTEKLYEYPRMNLLDQFEHFRVEKRRTLFYEYLPGRWGRKYRPAMARHLIWCNDSAENHPDMITYIYNFANVPKPDPKNWVSFDKLPAHRDKTPYFVYRVRMPDLQNYQESR